MKLEDLPKSYEPRDHEETIYRMWETSGFFNPDTLPDAHKRKPFSIMMAPPNVTGHIHVGHALENIISDIIIRRKRMEGYKTLFLPGKDHAGIAGQYVVEREIKKEGKTRQSLGREKFLERVWEWMREYGSSIDQELKCLGISTDWSRVRFTMDERYQHAVEKVFLQYHEKGYIYRGKRVVSWCPRCQTTLSDLELAYEPEKGKLYFIKYGPAIVATTRPETKLGDTALAVHPHDERYHHMVNTNCVIQSVDPNIASRKSPKIKEYALPVVADEAADPQFGSGIIKVTPAHDQIDFDISERHPEIKILQIIGEDGRMTEMAGSRYAGLTVEEARTKIVEDLEKLGLIEKIEEYEHSVAHCDRCASVIEPLISDQWFLKVDKLSERARKAIEKNAVVFVPENRKKMMLDWISGIRDWNISRQLWWGHRIPAWHCACSKPKWHVSVSLPQEKCKVCKKEWVQTTDVLDTWFSSALWPFATLGWPEKNLDLDTFYPTAIISSAREIFYLWIFRMLFSGIELTGDAPFKIIYTHPTILDARGAKMSKSKGNVVDPIKLVSTYGIDATRFGIIWQVMGTQDIHWSEDSLRAGKKFLNKLWNSGRFILIRIGTHDRVIKPPSKITHAHNKEVLEALADTQQKIEAHMNEFEFGQALHVFYDFYWHTVCDIFLEKAKTDTSPETQQTLFYVFAVSLKQLHPFIPFITEYLWNMLPRAEKTPLIIERI